MHTFTKYRQDDGLYLYCVGYWSSAYGKQVTWQPLRDCATADEAVAWVNFLNGGMGDNTHVGVF